MRSKTSFCNGTLLRRNLIRFCPLWVAFLAVWIVLLPLSIFSGGAYRYGQLSDLQTYILGNAASGGCIIGMIYAILTSMALFSYLYSPRSVNTLCALPVRRETMFGTNLAAGLLVWLVPSLIVALLTWVATAVVGLPAPELAAQWLAITGLHYLFFFGLGCVCAALVGHLLALPVLYVLLNFTAVVVNYFANLVLSTFVYGMSSSNLGIVLGRFSPVYYICAHETVSPYAVTQTVSFYRFTRWGYLGILAGVGVLLLLCALFLQRGRRMESAGDVVSVRCLRPVFKYCFTVGCSLVLGVLAAVTLFSGNRNMPHLTVVIVCLLVGGFIGYFGAEMLLQKTLRVFRREWIGFGAFAAVLLCAVFAMEFDLSGYERYVPEVSEIASVQISSYYNQDLFSVSDEAHIADIVALHQGAVSLKKQQEAERRNSDQDDYDSSEFNFTYKLKNGRTITRHYTISAMEAEWRDETSLARQFNAVYNDPYLVELRCTPPFEISPDSISWASVNSSDVNGDNSSRDLSGEEAYELYTDCVLPDVRDGLAGRTALYRWDDQSIYTADVSFDFNRPVTEAEADRQVLYRGTGNVAVVSSQDYYLNVTPSVGSRTAQWLTEHGIELTLQTEYDAYQNSRKQAAAAKS